MEIPKLWFKVHGILEDARNKVRTVVREIATKIDNQYGEVLSELARSLGCNLYLTIEESMNNPVLIVPILYIRVPARASLRRQKELIEEVNRKIGDWASNARLQIRTISIDITDTIKCYSRR